jgi:hypothetical protein
MSVLTYIAGVVGAVLRYIEANTVFEEATGLAVRNAPVSLCLAGLSLLMAAVIAVCSVAIGKKKLATLDVKNAFPMGSIVVLALVTVCGVVISLGAAGNYILDTGEKEIFRIAYSVLGAASGIAVIVAALKSFREDGGNYARLYIIPTVFMCLWLVMTYKDNNTNPVLIEYCYKCLAVCGGTLAFYYAAGHGYGKPAPKRTVATHLIGAYFCLVTVSDAGNIAQAAVFGATAIVLLVNVCLYVNSEKAIDETTEEKE